MDYIGGLYGGYVGIMGCLGFRARVSLGFAKRGTLGDSRGM